MRFGDKKVERCGFSLVELLITIGIIVIIATLTVPSFINYQNRKLLSNSTVELLGYLRDIQQKSISQEGGSQWGIYIETSGSRDSYKVFYGPSYAGGTVTVAVYLPVKIQFINPTQGLTKEIIFSKLTGLPVSSNTISLSLINSSSICESISINTAGLISSETCP